MAAVDQKFIFFFVLSTKKNKGTASQVHTSLKNDIENQNAIHAMKWVFYLHGCL